MTIEEMMTHIEATKAEFEVAEKSSWEGNVTAINDALDSSGCCTSPNTRKALLALLKMVYHRGYQEGSVYTVTKLMEDMGLGAVAKLLRQPTRPQIPVDPTLN